MENKLIDDIITFSKIGNNWDGYCGVPTKLDVIRNTLLLLTYIESKCRDKITEYYPNPHGTISLECENENILVSVEVGKDSFGYFISNNNGEMEYFNKQLLEENYFDKLKKRIEAL